MFPAQSGTTAFRKKMSLTGPVPVSLKLWLSLKDPRTGLGKVVIFKCEKPALKAGQVVLSQIFII